MLRCEYCARILKINRSDTYLLCSQKCKSKFKNKNQIKKVDEYVLGSINNEWYFVKDIVLPKKSNKFEIVSSISRMKKLRTFNLDGTIYKMVLKEHL